MSSSKEIANNPSEEEILLAEDAVLSTEGTSFGLAGILQSIQSSLVDLAKASKDQSTAFQNLHEDILLRQDSDVATEQGGETDTVDPTNAVNALLTSDGNDATTSTPHSEQSSDTEPKLDLLESLTQAYIPSQKKSPAVAEKIAALINSILSGKLSPEVAKERGGKYFPPENCENVCTSLVNEEIWDLLPRRSRSVDLAFQRVQETLTQGISSIALLADKLAKDVQNKQTPNMTDIMHHVMDSLVLVTHANWSLNMKRRELIKPDLNLPFTRLCKPDITPTTKLFGDDLQKHLKEMTDVSRVGKQLQKKPFQQRPHSQKPYERPRQNYNYKNQSKKPFLVHGRAALQTGWPHKRNSKKDQ